MSLSATPSFSHRLGLLTLSQHPLLVPILIKLWQPLHPPSPHFSLHRLLCSSTYTAALSGLHTTATRVLGCTSVLPARVFPLGTGVTFGRFCYDVVSILGFKDDINEVETKLRRLFKACTDTDILGLRVCFKPGLLSKGENFPVIQRSQRELDWSRDWGYGRKRKTRSGFSPLMDKTRSKSIRPAIKRSEISFPTRFSAVT